MPRVAAICERGGGTEGQGRERWEGRDEQGLRRTAERARGGARRGAPVDAPVAVASAEDGADVALLGLCALNPGLCS